MATSEDYKFNGIKGGVTWKTRLERYFIARAPVLRDILEFAELEDMTEVTLDRFSTPSQDSSRSTMWWRLTRPSGDSWQAA